jgi:hypothetical protein
MLEIRRAKTFLKNHPRLGDLVIQIIIFFTGLGIGIYITLSFQNQITALGISGAVIALLSVSGNIIMVVHLTLQWQKSRKVPVLEFDGYLKVPESKIYSGTTIKDQFAYFVRIKDTNSDSEGDAEDSVGYLEVKGNIPQDSLGRSATIWNDNNLRSISFYKQADLRLFSIINTEAIIFPLAKTKENFTPIRKNYFDFINKVLIIDINCKRGFIKEKTRSVKISDIIRTAVLVE